MSLLLKVMQHIPTDTPPELAPYGDELEYTIYGDIVNCQFRYYRDEDCKTSGSPYGEAIIRYLRPSAVVNDPNAPNVGGAFVVEAPMHEAELYVQLCGEAFLMNANGRTISSFRPKRPRGRAQVELAQAGQAPGSSLNEVCDDALCWIPWTTAALIRKAARKSGGGALLEILDRHNIAVDA